MLDHLVDSVDEFLLKHLDFMGLEEDKLKLSLYFYLCIPLGFLFTKLTNPTARLWYNLVLGLFFTLLMGKGWFIYINVVAITVYVVTHTFQKCVLPVFIISFAALSYVHVHRLLYDYLSWKMDFNTILMISTARFIYYAVDKQDGNVKNENGFLMYYSYAFMFTNLILGPIPFKNFVTLIRRTEDFTNFKYRDALITLLKASALGAGEILIRPYFDVSFVETPTWKDMNIVYKHIAFHVISVAARFKYFGAFKFTQAAMDATGMSYNPKTGRCDRFSTSNYNYELEKNVIVQTNNWNTLVQQWLKYCFFDRLGAYGGMSYYIVFSISAIWHGFYLTYYLFFFFWALINQNCKYFYKAQSKFYFIPQVIRHSIAWIANQFCVDQFGMGVAMLDWNKNMRFNNDMYWSTQILTLTIFLFFFITQFGQKKAKK